MRVRGRCGSRAKLACIVCVCVVGGASLPWLTFCGVEAGCDGGDWNLGCD